MLASTADTVTLSIVGLFVLIALIVIWRVAVQDRAVRKIRVGVFLERERNHHQPEPSKGDENPRPHRQTSRGEKRPEWPPPRQDPDREPSHPGARKNEHGADT